MFSLLVSILVGYVLVLALSRIFEARLIFFPNYPDRLGGDWKPRGLGVQDVWLTADDGTKLHAWWIPHETRVTLLIAPQSTNFSETRRPMFWQWSTEGMGEVRESQASGVFTAMPRQLTCIS